MNSKTALNYQRPWFIKILKGEPIITVHDFNLLVGVDVMKLDAIKLKPSFHPHYFIRGVDINGLGQGPLREEFERVNNVHYEEETFLYLRLSGVAKALKILENEGVLPKKDINNKVFHLSNYQ